ncbi:MAG: DUF4340 domain-containing protein [Lachnospiraceae bacterium]|nr:DUF4340 domain-containing protein [Lachnospiraceae bacterium]
MTKKNVKKLIIGLAVILLLGGAYGALTVYTGNQEKQKAREEEQKAAQAVVVAIKGEDVREISFNGDEGLITLARGENGWQSPDDEAFAMNEEKMDTLLADLSALSANRTLENVEDPGQYGLKSPSRRIRVTTADGNVTEIAVGDRNGANGEVYFQVGQGTDTVYLTSTLLDTHFAGTLRDFAAYDEFPKISPETIREFDVQKAEAPYLVTMTGDEKCTVTDENGDTQAANLNILGTMQNNVSNISWADNLEYNCRDFAPYGLDNPVAVVDITYEESTGNMPSLPETGEGKDGKDMARSVRKTVRLSIGGQDDKDNFYVRLDDSPQVHTIREEYLLDFVESSANTFWSLTYSFVSIGDLDHLEVAYGGAVHTLRRVVQGDEKQGNAVVTWLADEKVVEKKLFTDFYYACVSVTAQERLDTVPENTGEPELALHYYLTDGTEKIIQYYPADQNFYTVIYEDGTKAAHTNRLYVNTMAENLETLLASVR